MQQDILRLAREGTFVKPETLLFQDIVAGSIFTEKQGEFAISFSLGDCAQWLEANGLVVTRIPLPLHDGRVRKGYVCGGLLSTDTGK